MATRTLDTKSTKQVLIPTKDSKNPFVIKIQDDRGINEYWLIRADGTLTGDGFSTEEKHYFQAPINELEEDEDEQAGDDETEDGETEENEEEEKESTEGREVRI